MKKYIFIAGIFVFMIFSSAAGAMGEKAAEEQTAARILPQAPDFTLKDLKGTDVTLSSFRGKKVLLVFGATWCPYCVDEVPHLNAFFDKHRDKDVKILNVDIRESVAKVANFVEKHSIKYTVLLDTDGKVAAQYEVLGIPANVLIDESGMIKYKGSMPQGGFEALLK